MNFTKILKFVELERKVVFQSMTPLHIFGESFCFENSFELGDNRNFQ